MTVPTIRLLLIGIAVLVGYAWAQCEDDAQMCLDTFTSELDVDDICPHLNEFRTKLHECEVKAAGCETQLQTVASLKLYLDQYNSVCEAEQCTVAEPDRLDCLKPLNVISDPSMLSAMCQLTMADVDDAYDCVLDLAEEKCKADIKVRYDSRVVDRLALSDAQRQVCDIVRDTSCRNVQNLDSSFHSCYYNPSSAIDFDTFCTNRQTELDCVEDVLNCEKLEKKFELQFADLLSKIKPFGCMLTYKGKTLPTSSDCNIRETLNCYADIQASMQVLGHVTDGVSSYAWVNKPQSDVCQAVMDFTDTHWSTLTTCVHTHSSGCETLPQPPRPNPTIRINIGFLRRSEVAAWRDYCRQDCNGISSQLDNIKQCLKGKDLNAFRINTDCTSLGMLVTCLQPKIATCPVLQTSWLNFIREMGAFANLFTSCSQPLGVAECLNKETQEEEIKAMCYYDDAHLVQSRGVLCSRLEGFTRCVEDHSIGCSKLTQTYIEPHYAYFSAMNHAHRCSIEYREKKIEVTVAGNCWKENYLMCFDVLTTAMDLPKLYMTSNLRNHTNNVTSAVTILSPIHYLNKHSMRCDAVMEVDFDAIDTCLSEQASICSRSDAGAIHNPMTFDMKRIKGDAETACSDDCVDVDPNSVTSGCVQNLQLMCSSVDAQNIFGDDVSEVCQELQEAWTCMKGAAGQCEYTISQLQSLWIDECESASLTCFGIGVPTTTTTTTTTTTSRPRSAAGDMRAWIGVVWIGLIGWVVSM